jgi:hypothetical protein
MQCLASVTWGEIFKLDITSPMYLDDCALFPLPSALLALPVLLYNH